MDAVCVAQVSGASEAGLAVLGGGGAASPLGRWSPTAAGGDPRDVLGAAAAAPPPPPPPPAGPPPPPPPDRDRAIMG